MNMKAHALPTLAGIELALDLEARNLRDAATGPRFHWRGIHITIDAYDFTVLRARVDGIEDFIDAHGRPVTHARALVIAKAIADSGRTEDFEDALSEASFGYNEMLRGEQAISNSQDY